LYRPSQLEFLKENLLLSDSAKQENSFNIDKKKKSFPAERNGANLILQEKFIQPSERYASANKKIATLK
jgi:hypothetical protein